MQLPISIIINFVYKSLFFCVTFFVTVTLFGIIDLSIAKTTAEKVATSAKIFSDAVIPFVCLLLSIVQTPKVKLSNKASPNLTPCLSACISSFSSVCPSAICSYVCLPIYAFPHMSVCPSMHFLICLSAHLCISSYVCLPICPFANQPVSTLFICSSDCLSICLSVCQILVHFHICLSTI
jgi:hypothetical protein